jgi:hypothetical protein
MPNGSSPRLASLDQFRGYTVAGMLLVNFVGSFTLVPAILKHHHTYCSYADTIMPQFFLAVGMAYRMTALKRLESDGLVGFARRMSRRIIGLLAIAVIVHGIDWPVRVPRGDWPAFAAAWWREPGLTLLDIVRRDYFQTLTHIAVTMLWTLPVITLGAWPRLVWLVGSVLLHGWLSHSWYHAWVNADPRGIDGGVLGFLTWTVPLVVGSFAWDLLSSATRDGGSGSRSDSPQPSPLEGEGGSRSEPGEGFRSANERSARSLAAASVNGPPTQPSPSRGEGSEGGVVPTIAAPLKLAPAARREGGSRGSLRTLLLGAAGLMGIGYALACVGPTLALGAANSVGDRAGGDASEAEASRRPPLDAGESSSPVYRVIDLGGVRLGLDWPPFVKPPHPSPRTMWAMSQRSGSASYLLFASGFGLAMLVPFVIAADRLRWELGLFRTLGTNALAAYVVHGMISDRLKVLTPRDAPSWYLWSAFALYFGLTWLVLRWLERNRVFLRL